MKLVIAEKPSVAQPIARVIGATKRCDGYLEGNNYIVSWCVGHLVELAEPGAYLSLLIGTLFFYFISFISAALSVIFPERMSS